MTSRRAARRVLALLALSGSLFGGVAVTATVADSGTATVEAGRSWHR